MTRPDIIFTPAAGLATRLKPLTDTVPKALLPVCGEPMIFHTWRWLSEAFGKDAKITCNAHKFYDEIIRASRKFTEKNSVPVEVLRETALLGSVGWLNHFGGLSGQSVLAANPDLRHESDVSSFWDAHVQSGADVSILAKRASNIKEKNVGSLLVGSNHRVLSVDSPEKIFPENDQHQAVSPGVFAYGPKFISHVLRQAEKNLEFRPMLQSFLGKGFDVRVVPCDVLPLDLGSSVIGYQEGVKSLCLNG